MLDSRKVEECLYDVLLKRGSMTRDALRKFGSNIKTRYCPNGCDIETTGRKLRILTHKGLIMPVTKRTKSGSNYIWKYAVVD